MARLRAPGGCPWDREQTFDTIKPYTLEETYEVLDAIDRRDWNGPRRRAGRLHAAGRLLRADGGRTEPLPHRRRAGRDQPEAGPAASARFRRETAETAGDVKKIWDEVKAAEKKDKGRGGARPAGVVPRALPALVEAQQIASRAAGVGFDWENPEQVHRKAARGTGRVRPRRARNASQRRARRRIGRSALRAGEPGALCQGGSRAGAAQDQRQIPRALRASSNASWPSAARQLQEANIEEMEALWQEAKR